MVLKANGQNIEQPESCSCFRGSPARLFFDNDNHAIKQKIAIMNKILYVGNLSSEVDEKILHSLFEEYGPVDSTEVIKNHVSGRSKGFGFVVMKDAESALRARQHLEGTTIKGKSIVVDFAKDRGFYENNDGILNRSTW
jgi:RNA recognition motif-containing protein